MNTTASSPSSTPSQPRLGPQQLAFVRCWAEGLDLAVAWHRFMPAGTAMVDARRARSELQRLLDQLRALARAHGRNDIVALLYRDPEAMRDAGPKAPTLDKFRDQQPADFYSEDELLQLYRAEHGDVDARSAARRRQRLRERLVLALQWLERQVLRAPSPDDATQAWLDRRVAARLAVAGIHTLGELMFWIGSKGFHWQRPIPRLGAVGAARIVWWLRQNEASLGRLPASALTPASRLDRLALTPPPRSALAPLERFVAPPTLDGRQGSNRATAQHCRLAAHNDLQALQAWLGSHEAGSHTWRAYRREAERLLLWATLQRRKALSSLDAADCADYLLFLAAPGPGWCGPRNSPRFSEAWRPFEGPLSARSRQVAQGILRSLFAWLRRQHYLASNPWDDVQPAQARALAAPALAGPELRALSAHQWQQVQAWLQAQPPSPARLRLGFILEFAAGTGLRLSELAAARAGWLQQRQGDAASPLWLCVPGQGRRAPRELALSPRLVESFREQLRARGLGGEPLAVPAQTPLIAHLGCELALGTARLHDIVRAAAVACARQLWSSDPEAAQAIRRMSMHWLRHSHGRHEAARGLPAEVLRNRLGHRSLASTAVYLREAAG